MDNKKRRPQLYLSFTLRPEETISVLRHGDQAIIIVSVIQNDFEGGGTLSEPKWRNCSRMKGTGQFDNLELRGYLSADMNGAYGYHVAYWDIHEAESKRAALMAKTLKMIEKKFSYYNTKEGDRLDIGVEVNRFCRAIGAEGLIEWTETISNYDDCPYRKWNLAQIPNVVNSRIEGWHIEHPNKSIA
jgi:hypothetical protein